MINDIDIKVEGSGPGRPLVMVHSLLTDWRAFDPVVPLLTTERRVVRVSLPGFGATPPLNTADPTIFDLADVVAEALTRADVGSEAAVLGNGLGAFVVVALAVKAGHRFGPLISANGGAVFSEDRRGAFTTMSDLVDAGGMEAVVEIAVRRIYTEAYLARHPEVIEQRRQVMLATDPKAFSAACRALRDMNLTDGAGGVTNPTLVIAGGADQTTPPEMARQLAAVIPGADFVELADCGHCPPLEQPTQFAAAVAAFLGRWDQLT